MFYANAAGQTVANGADVPLNNSAPDNTSGAFTLASSRVTVAQAGIYLISYNVNIAALSTGVYQLIRNTTLIPGTIGSTENSAAGGHQLTGLTLIRLNAGDIISIRNVGNLGDFLQGGTDGQTPTSAMLSILKVG